MAPPTSGENGSIPRPSAARGPRRLRVVGAAGRELSLEQAIAEAHTLAEDTAQAAHAQPEERAPSAGALGGLSPREQEVLRLVAEGLTNAQIAKRPFLSPRTVNAHLNSIYHKLGVSSRSAAVRIAVEHGLA